MDDNKLIMVIAVIALGVAVIGAAITYFSVADLVTEMTGYVSSAEANLTIEQHTAVNFTTNFASWGSGRVDANQDRAFLTTLKTNNVTGGNWTLLGSINGLRVENIGNVNVSLNLTAGKSAATFIGGTNPGYQWNISDGESGSCVNSTVLGNLSDTTTTEFAACHVFRFANASDQVRIDFNLTIPEDAKQGLLTDTITAVVVIVAG